MPDKPRGPGPPMQSPIRPNGFYQMLLARWSADAILAGLTERETFLCAAQFAGLAIARCDANAAEHEAQLEVAAGAMRTAYAGNMYTRTGRGYSASNRAKESVD